MPSTAVRPEPQDPNPPRLWSGEIDDVAGRRRSPAPRAKEQPRVTQVTKVCVFFGSGLVADHQALPSRVVEDRRVPVLSGKSDEFIRLRVGGDEVRLDHLQQSQRR